jgi:threonine/homoserine/homoserine lactone efflux protein
MIGGFDLFVRGVAAGFAISAPVGPVNVLCISQTLVKGPRAGVISGLGAAAADTIYGSIAGFSISFIISFLKREEFWIRIFGGMVLIGIGVLYYFKKPRPLSEQRRETSVHAEFATAFLLNLTNPTTVLSFLAVLALLGLGEHRAWWLTGLMVAGIFTGAMIWWIILTVASNHFRDRFNDGATVWMNRIAGLAIGGFGLLTMILSHWVKR